MTFKIVRRAAAEDMAACLDMTALSADDYKSGADVRFIRYTLPERKVNGKNNGLKKNAAKPTHCGNSLGAASHCLVSS